MPKANVLLISHIFIHAAAKVYPDVTQSLCLTVWLRKKKKKRRKGDEKKRRNKLMQRHEEEGKKEASRALQKYKATFCLLLYLP